jgi:hypothetical protein
MEPLLEDGLTSGMKRAGDCTVEAVPIPLFSASARAAFGVVGNVIEDTTEL